jgi:uncharacterized Zn finger protein
VSRWSSFGWYRPTPKKPPPARGIRMKKAGTTWWGQRWIEALEHVLRGDSARLARGRTYARAGRTHDLVVKGRQVTAKVTGSRARPYEITIALTELGEAAWRKAIVGMARKARFSAELLAGEMPREIDQVFREAGVSLFPRTRADLRTRCSCPDWGDPCKHVAATHYVLGEAFDRDPFLLFELRGRTKEQVIAALRAARVGASETTSKKGGKAHEDAAGARLEAPTVRLGKLTARDYDTPRAPLPPLHFSFDGPVTHAAVLRQLGAPAAWAGDATPADVLAPLVRAAAETARRIAMAEPSEAQSAVAPATKRSTKPQERRARGRVRAPRGRR